jgi:N-methylhydantoinase A
MDSARFTLGIDVGGTFTDIVACDRTQGTLAVHKVPTTPWDVAEGLLEAIKRSAVPAAGIDEIVHGTTAATNALLERKGAQTGLLTTAGLRDLLELRDGGRRSALGRQAAFEPLVPRQWRREVSERLGPGGEVLERLREEDVVAAAAALRPGIEALAVAFLHAERNPAHERQTLEILRRIWPEAHVVLGSEVCPFPDERLRTATAVLSAYLMPLLTRYVGSLERALRDLATEARFRFLESSGSSCDPGEIRSHPLRTILSGPAGGARAGGCLARLLGLPVTVTADMGGTSLDTAIVRDGLPELCGDRTLEFGLTVGVPSVAIHAAGVGGGSLVWTDGSVPGGLQVGPQSAGAHPGPACFGRGGRKPTVTDANLLLGRILGDRGDLGLPPLDAGRAAQAMLAEVCPAVNRDPVGAARIVVEVAEAKIVGFLRTQLAEHGLLPGEATLIAFGGAGPVHAAAVAGKLGLSRVVVPYLAAGFSALGALLSPPAQTAMVPVGEALGSLGPERLAQLVARAFPDPSGGALRLSLMLRRGDGPSEDILPVPDPGESVEDRVRRYHAFTGRAYGISPAPSGVQVTRLLAVLEEAHAPLALSDLLTETFARQRQAVAAGSPGLLEAGPNGLRVVQVERLPVEGPALGPALVILPGASAFVPEGTAYHVDRRGNLIMETKNGGQGPGVGGRGN